MFTVLILFLTFVEVVLTVFLVYDMWEDIVSGSVSLRDGVFLFCFVVFIMTNLLCLWWFFHFFLKITKTFIY